MDSDNVGVADPSTLFDSAAYVAKGAVLWPDYWASSAAPDLQRILPKVSLPNNTFESGQMVLNKQRLDTLKGLYLHGSEGLWQRQYAGLSDTTMLVHCSSTLPETRSNSSICLVKKKITLVCEQS